MAKLITIEGTIEIEGIESKFRIDNDINDSWSQWGVTQEQLFNSMPIVQALDRAIKEEVELYNEDTIQANEVFFKKILQRNRGGK